MGLACIAAALVIGAESRYLFSLSPRQVSKLVYGDNPFAESSLGIARYIRTNSTPADTVAILGSEPQILFYAKRRSASRQIFVYSMTDQTPFTRSLQQELLTDLMAGQPKFLVVSTQPSSWNVPPSEVQRQLQPFMAYVAGAYAVVGVVDILPEGGVSYQWIAPGADARARTTFPLFVLQRNRS
jgi:hypothetical protein